MICVISNILAENIQEKINFFETILERHPQDRECLTELATIYMDLKQDEIALSYLNRLLSLNGEKVHALYNLAVVLGRKGQHEEAMRCWEASGEYLDAIFQLGVKNFHLENYKEAIKQFERIAEAINKGQDSDLNSMEIDDLFVSICFNMGKSYMKLGKYQDAIEAFEAALSKDVNDINSFLNLGWCYKSLGKWKTAVKTFKEALTIFPGNIELILELGIIHEVHEKYQEALEYFLKAKKMDPFDERAKQGLKRVYHFR